ncbi:MAG: hypothetical protein JAY72_07905 [Candidatus Thiodiazotropha endolucinida]|nr:hypothetical protein [Candidatus Thiodiazotropha taylori]MCW4321590.1 hypothetical protein [Candidatus Thiodiazotropha taylori]
MLQNSISSEEFDSLDDALKDNYVKYEQGYVLANHLETEKYKNRYQEAVAAKTQLQSDLGAEKRKLADVTAEHAALVSANSKETRLHEEQLSNIKKTAEAAASKKVNLAEQALAELHARLVAKEISREGGEDLLADHLFGRVQVSLDGDKAQVIYKSADGNLTFSGKNDFIDSLKTDSKLSLVVAKEGPSGSGLGFEFNQQPGVEFTPSNSGSYREDITEQPREVQLKYFETLRGKS